MGNLSNLYDEMYGGFDKEAAAYDDYEGLEEVIDEMVMEKIAEHLGYGGYEGYDEDDFIDELEAEAQGRAAETARYLKALLSPRAVSRGATAMGADPRAVQKALAKRYAKMGAGAGAAGGAYEYGRRRKRRSR